VKKTKRRNLEAERSSRINVGEEIYEEMMKA
jgi:hypothetical protein